MKENPNIIINIIKQIIISFNEKIFFILPISFGIKFNGTPVSFQNNFNYELIKTKFVVISRKNFILFTVNN